MKKLAVALGALLVVAGALLIPVGGGRPAEALEATRPATMDMSAFSTDRPDKSLRLLFIHHSCGGQLFAPQGPEREMASCIYTAHPNGGDARKLLEEEGYEVHEASYGSEIGDKTDLFDWLPKFKNKGEKILTVDRNDTFFKDARKHDIVLFKSCYPNSDFAREGAPPGNPAGPELTYWNARATLTALLPELAKHPEVLYVYLTAPPRAPIADDERAFKLLLKKLRGVPTARDLLASSSALARRFNDWVVATDGWLKDYPHKNVAVYDYYDVLTGGGASNLSRYPSGDGTDSHPSAAGNTLAAGDLVQFLNQAVRRAELAK